MLIASPAGLALALPLAGITAPDEARMQKAKPRDGMGGMQGMGKK